MTRQPQPERKCAADAGSPVRAGLRSPAQDREDARDNTAALAARVREFVETRARFRLSFAFAFTLARVNEIEGDELRLESVERPDEAGHQARWPGYRTIFVDRMLVNGDNDDLRRFLKKGAMSK